MYGGDIAAIGGAVFFVLIVYAQFRASERR